MHDTGVRKPSEATVTIASFIERCPGRDLSIVAIRHSYLGHACRHAVVGLFGAVSCNCACDEPVVLSTRHQAWLNSPRPLHGLVFLWWNSEAGWQFWRYKKAVPSCCARSCSRSLQVPRMQAEGVVDFCLHHRHLQLHANFIKLTYICLLHVSFSALTYSYLLHIKSSVQHDQAREPLS